MHRLRLRAALSLALLGAFAPGCQDYNFNKVGHCLIYPGSEQVTLSSISTADILFVVDDSGSMAGEQGKLATAFSAFIGSLNAYNTDRVASGLQPFEFHIAMTTTSVFYNPPANATCQATCGSASNVCCRNDNSQPMMVALTCPVGNECGAGYSCKTTCAGHDSEATCCDSSGSVIEMKTVACTTPGAECGALSNRYQFPQQAKTCTTAGSTQCASDGIYTSCATDCGGYTGTFCCATVNSCVSYTQCNAGFTCGNCGGLTGVCCHTPTTSDPRVYPQGQPEFVTTCQPGDAQDGSLYPHGSFVGLGTNPRVLHFDKGLYGTLVGGVWQAVDPVTATNSQGFTRQQLIDFFKSNVNVGTCGSGQEQGLQASRLAVAKALAGKQMDMRDSKGALVAAPGIPADWPHADAKLVVVYIGDEDDCGSPEDPFRGVILSGTAGHDTCSDPSLGQTSKEFLVSDVIGDLQKLGRPLGGAFVVSTAQATCVDAACTPGTCCDYQCTGSASICGSSTCGGQAGGTRFLAAADALRGGGADVVEGSMCDPGAMACATSTDCASVKGPSGEASVCSNTCQGATGSYCCISTGALTGTLAGTNGFAPLLQRVAEIVKPPSALLLPTQPAEAAVSVLRIIGTDGLSRKTCHGPAPIGLTFQQAHDQGYDWWFTASGTQITADQKAPSAASRYVYLNHDTRNCEANPGETYSADYIGRLPASGCTSDADCTAHLGTANAWKCFAGVDATGLCIAPSSTAPGTCLCDDSGTVCPK